MRMQRSYTYVLGAIAFIVYFLYLHTQAFLAPRSVSQCSNDNTHPIDLELVDEYLKIVATSITGNLLETAGIAPGVGTEANPHPYDPERRRAGRDWPLFGYTMTGDLRVEALRKVIEDALKNNVVGDFIELGVWRGGTSIMAAAVFKAYKQTNRKVWVCDSFEGLPEAAEGLADKNYWSQMSYLKVSKEQVMHNFQKYGLLNDNIQFVKGFFFDSLPKLRHQQLHSGWKLSILRLDGDMYESCLDSIFNLYEFLSVGGYVIIDDWNIPECNEAINEFLRTHSLVPNIVRIDKSAVYWKKEIGHNVKVDYDHYVGIKANSNRPVVVN